MKKIKTHHLFWFTALFYIILSCVWYNNDDVNNINVRDTYFVISNFHVGIFFTQTFFILGFIYWLSFKSNLKLINALTKTHTIVTIGSVFAYFIGSYVYDSIYSNEFPLFDNQSKFNVYTLILIVLSGLAQFVFIINIVISSINRSKKFK